MEPVSQPLDVRFVCGIDNSDFSGYISFLSSLMRFIGIPTLAALSFFVCPQVQGTESAQEVLNRALYYADLYNWHAAGPLFQRAEQKFRAAGDRRNQLYAQIGVLRASTAPPLPVRSQYLADQLADSPLLRSDLPLQLFALTVKGDLDGEFDQAAAREDWTAVTDL